MLSNLTPVATKVGKILKKHSFMLVTAESCTGGMVSQTITSIPGASQWFDCGFITYSNQSKIALLDVSPHTIDQFGAVSEQTVLEMVKGALKNSYSHIALAITGIAGPSGGSKEKPVGTVWFAWAGHTIKSFAIKQNFSGNRQEIRMQSVQFALKQIVTLLS